MDAIEGMTSDEKARCYISYQTFEGLRLTGKGETILFVLSGFLKSYPILNKIPSTRLFMSQLNSYKKLNNFPK